MALVFLFLRAVCLLTVATGLANNFAKINKQRLEHSLAVDKLSLEVLSIASVNKLISQETFIVFCEHKDKILK
jgi:hypothetical protein